MPAFWIKIRTGIVRIPRTQQVVICGRANSLDEKSRINDVY